MPGVIKESEQLLNNIREWDETEGPRLSDEDDCGYGHAVRILGVRAEDNQKLSPDEQKAFLRSRALELIEKYGIDSNKGYGSKTHMDGIRKHGITKWHRRTFGLCKEFV